MIEFENVEVFGWEASIRGLRSPMNSWDKSDSGYVTEYDEGGFDAEFYKIGDNDLDLMKKLIAAGCDGIISNRPDILYKVVNGEI